MEKKLSLGGTPWIIAGIVLMLAPIELLLPVGVWADAAGYLLMATGLLLLHKQNGGFTGANVAAIACFALCACQLVLPKMGHIGHLLSVVPMVVYCFMLYFMCTSYAKMAHGVGDEGCAHHFISHMWVDIVATALEIVAHLFGLEGIPYYIVSVVCIVCEIMLMTHMWHFYRHYDGHPASNGAYA